MPGARSSRSCVRKLGWISAMRGSSRWLTKPPVYDMHVEGDAPGAALNFSAWTQGVRQLAVIVDAAALDEALEAAVRYAPHVTRIDAAVPCALTAVCEGRSSGARDELGVHFS